MNRYALALQNIGMEVSSENIELAGRPYRVATIKAGYSSELKIYFNERGDARIDKPNRTTKWVYEKSSAQLRQLALQVLSFYNFGR